MEFVILILLSYLLGSVPGGYLIAKLNKVDITKVGSGNIGTTNVWRTLGPKWGIATFLFDAGKGLLALILVNILFNQPMVGYYIIAGALAILGHFKSIFLKFKGGKTVATSLGVIIGLIIVKLLPIWFAVIIIGVFLLTLWRQREVSRASMYAAITAVIIKLVFYGGFNQQSFEVTIFIIGILVLIIFTHRENIKRIQEGIERKS